MIEQITGMLALIGVLSLLCQWLGWQLRLPAILPLLCCGLLVGPGLGWLDPDAIFGNLLFPLISLGVAIILFEGALTLNFKEIRDHGRMVTHLVTIGAAVTWLCISMASWCLFDFTPSIALLFGALVVVTGPTVIVPMLRTVRPKSELSSILRWEGIVIDPIGALIAVLVYEYITVSSDQTSHVLIALGSMLGIGLGAGALAGYLLGWVLRRNILPHYLTNTAVLTVTLGVFVGSNLLQEESGLLTVTVMGIWLANMRGVSTQSIIEFKETLTVLLISALFILLAARLNSDAMLNLGWQGLVLLLVVLFIARPLSIWISGFGTSLSSRDKWFLSWIAPRGIVAAAVSSLFAIKLEQRGVDGADMLVPLAFLIIIGTVVIQSLTARRWAQHLGVTAKSAQGILIFGGSKFARDLAKILVSKGIKVIIADSNWDNVRLARMDNIQVYFGNPVSEHANNFLDLGGIGKVLILSPYQQLNPVVYFHFQDIFGPERVYGVNTTDASASARHQLSESYLSRMCLFSDSVSYSKLASLMSRDAVLKSTNLTDNFSYQMFLERYGESVIPLIYMKGGKVHMITTETTSVPNGVELISLIPKEAMEHQQKKAAEEKELKELQEKEKLQLEDTDIEAQA
ncbi:sodium:proton antiporter [Shewanella avicenniae]|uniref:Sodium:proton antiporter n=1 Tax=Shewanella avicenniae TaxID=2814294 RepID=A0ABX7QUU0_9GAMM|nr:sodium:proton antiporter [Shewanella avicenniae]QSX35249.1 sodium:proton antiporter [Shewanella avicenniae]